MHIVQIGHGGNPEWEKRRRRQSVNLPTIIGTCSVWGLGPRRNGSPGHGDKLCRNWNGQRENYSYWLKLENLGNFGKIGKPFN
jgi:hypothetical protein